MSVLEVLKSVYYQVSDTMQNVLTSMFVFNKKLYVPWEKVSNVATNVIEENEVSSYSSNILIRILNFEFIGGSWTKMTIGGFLILIPLALISLYATVKYYKAGRKEILSLIMILSVHSSFVCYGLIFQNIYYLTLGVLPGLLLAYEFIVSLLDMNF